MKRLSFSDIEEICEREQCRFNDLFLIGNGVYVMIDAADWRLPSKYRPLALDDDEIMRALLEALRRLDATEFESLEAFERAKRHKAAHASEFERLKYELYDLLTGASPEHKAPDGGQFYLELDGAAGEDVLLVCDGAESLDESLVASIQSALRSGNYTLNWGVHVSFENDGAAVRTIYKDRVAYPD